MDLLKLAASDAAGDAPDNAEQRAPDELLLELMDLVALAFPAPLSQFEVRFVPNEDGKTPALENLSGKSPPGAPARPDLGHADNAVLDAINALLDEFGEATLRDGGIKVLRGRIVVAEDEDGARNVALYDDSVADVDDDTRLVMTRRFDASELRWLLFTPALFRALNSTADAERAAATRVHEALLGMKRFEIDMKKARITFSPAPGDPRPPQPWAFELIGSFLDEHKRFMWGWANSAVDADVVAGVNALRAGSTDAGLRCFTDPEFGGPEHFFVRLAQHAAAKMGAFGVYRAPFAATHGKGVMFLALKAI